MATAAEIRTLAEPVLRAAGLQLWDVELSRDTVRVLVERDGGVDLDALGAASEALSELLDDHDELVPDDRYHLEVSSPGLERSLRTPEQYRRYLGTTVSVKTSVPVEGARRHRGTLDAVGAAGIELRSEGRPDGPPLELHFDQIDRTLTVVDWALALRAHDGPTPASAGPAASDAAPGPDDAGAAGPARAARETKDRSR